MRNWRSRGCGRSRRETGEPVASTPGGSDARGSSWCVGAAGVSDRRVAPVDAAPRTVRGGDDAALRAALRAISGERPRWGYRRAHARLLADGWSLNLQAHAAAVARGGPARAAAAAQTPAAVRVAGAGEAASSALLGVIRCVGVGGVGVGQSRRVAGRFGSGRSST